MIYSYSLCVALPLMLFFGFSFLFSKTPDKNIFNNYLRSRRIMGVALLLLAVNYSMHFFFEIRYLNPNAAILMNLTTYFLCYWLFSSALTSLLNRFYITRKRFGIHIGMWISFSLLSGIVLFILPEGMVQKVGLIAMAIWLIIYGLVLSRRLLLAYKKAVTILNNSFSDDIGTYIHWMSVFTYWAIIFGVGCGALTFLPDKYIFIWILFSVPFYIYLYICYQNYLLFYEQVENAMENEMPSENEALYNPEQEDGNTHELPGNSTEIIGKRINAWINMDKYVHPGLTITELSKELHTNRTYLSTYINTEYNMSFRNWITELRMEYAKRKIIQHPEKTIVEIAGISGFLSMSHFIKTFKEKEGCSPSTWKKTNQGNKKKADHETC